MSNAGRVVSREELAAWVAAERAAGRRVALANGVFDLLHVGHLRYLEAAAAMADRLVVAVNDDGAARALKGEGRPVVPAAERAELLAGLRCVDRVCLVPETDMKPTIEALRPDLQVKGTDYTEDSVPERAAIEACGGRVAIAGDPKDHAVTDLIHQIKKRR